MIAQLTGLDKLNINQCEAMAKKLGDGLTFDLCGPNGRRQAEWIDAHMGIFKIDGLDGFVMSSQFEFMPVWCENLMPSNAEIRGGEAVPLD